jgi:hypothetical protein
MKTFFEHIIDNETLQNIAMIPTIIFLSLGGTIFIKVDAKMIRSWFSEVYVAGENESVFDWLGEQMYMRITSNLVWKLCLQRGKEKAMLDLIRFCGRDRYSMEALKAFVEKKTKYKNTYEQVMLLR